MCIDITKRLMSSETPRWFLEQETLHLLLSTGWFKELIRDYVDKLSASYTIELKHTLYKLKNITNLKLN
jgi:hypothetical protein